ncbi:sterol desaturase family protein [Hazenella sp. IB182353]|uniref:sterol desaturase family protein n=1 Tax=Polycladospora coralii TaxID=2771432 RepID=UPI001747A233|nr:sterol desaturase family protein [Polycladospora coralii]MBS7530074.1 sterol desaturase family protein [Polycladospora coralii]
MRKYIREFFTFPDIMFACFLFSSGFIYLLFQPNKLIHIGLFLVGGIAFAITEYMTHRYLFHLKPPKNKTLHQLLKRLHYQHHEDPENLKLLFLPAWYFLPQFILVGAIAYAILGQWGGTVAILTGVIAYHLYYEWKHYIAHRPIKPLTRWGKSIKRYHLLHHFKNEHYWYGVTNSAMDKIMHTFPKEKEIETSATVKELDASK